MIHSISNKKFSIIPIEDTKTSSIIGDLLHLPAELLWELLRNSCTDKSSMPIYCGEIEEFEFWPHWNGEGSYNKLLVEPDVFIRFEAFDLIIEAKRDDEKGQYKEQWENEFISYFNNYPDDDRKVIMIAIGGSKDMNKLDLAIKSPEDTIVQVFKCNWLSVLIEVSNLLEEMRTIKYRDTNRSALNRILQDIIRGFNIHNLYYLKWLNELNKENFDIRESSIEVFKTNFRISNANQ